MEDQTNGNAIGKMDLARSFSMTSPSPRLPAGNFRSLASSQDSAFFQTSLGREYGGGMDWQQALEQSETRRLLLIQKMREAQDTITHQAQRLDDVEKSSKEISFQVNEFQYKEKECQRKIASLEDECKTNQDRQMEYLKVREDLQKKIESLSAELNTVRATCSLLLTRCKRKEDELHQQTSILKRLEDEVEKISKEKDVTQREMLSLLETNTITRGRFECLEQQHQENKQELDRLKEENRLMMVENHALHKQLMDEKTCCCGHKDEIRTLSAQVQTVDTEKQRIVKQTAELHELVSDLRSSMAVVVADKERFFQEKLNLHQQVQELGYEKEKCAKAKESVDEEVTELLGQLADTKSALKRKRDEMRQLKVELATTKRKVTNDKISLETTLQEQSETQQTTNRFTREQFALYEQEIRTLDQQLENTRKSMERMNREHLRSKEQMEEQVIKLKDELKLLRQERDALESKLTESQAKLKASEQNLKSHSNFLEGELERWKSSCENLSVLASRKEMEIQRLTKNEQDLQDEVNFMKSNHEIYQNQCEELLELRERSLRLEEESRRLLKERAENQQLIELLEMQKDVLAHLVWPLSRPSTTPSSTDSPKHITENCIALPRPTTAP